MAVMSRESAMALRVWWAFIWRMGLFGSLGGLVVGVVMVAVSHGLGLPVNTTNLIGYPITIALYVYIGMRVARHLIVKGFGPYRLAVVDRVDNNA
jgi:hypothetical protein